jgi:thiol-disulfide isomerase/thioredoxin
MKKIILLLALLSQLALYAQQSPEKKVPDTLKIVSIDAASIKEVAKYSQKKNTLLFTFASWCEPCHLHLPTAIKLAKDYNLDLYVVIIDHENSEGMNYYADYIYARR